MPDGEGGDVGEEPDDVAPVDDVEIDDPLEGDGEDPPDPVLHEYSINSYGADYPVDALVKRVNDGSIYVPAFQRGYVWTQRRASRFIESLLLGLPVPGIFLSKEKQTNKLLVIDGQQRLKTLQFFYGGHFGETGKTFSLRGLNSEFEGINNRTITPDHQRRLDDAIVHATIIEQVIPENDDSSTYHVFERLNTGGTVLSAQEIRSAINHGPFAEFLSAINTHEDWRIVYGRTSPRMRDQELILRFFALYYDAARYEEPFKEFLNHFMGRNRNLKVHKEGDFTQAFAPTMALARAALGDKPFRPVRALNAAVYDSVMVGLARRLEAGPVTDLDGVRTRYEALIGESSYADATSRATAGQDRVERRLALATAAFADLA